MNGAELLVAALENEGVKQIFGVPGEENLDVVDALRRSSIELVLTRHEQAAAFMAATHGRLTGRAGVCLATLGPGALNFTTGAAYALLGAMPMMMITGQKGILHSKQGHFQIVDIVSTMTPLTKMSRQISSPATIPSLVRDAFRVAQQERPGPVHLELPEDIAAEAAPDVRLVSPHPIDAPVASPSALDRAAQMIAAAERPLIMLGAVASRPKLADPLSDAVHRLQIPFFNTQMGKGAISGCSDLYLGTAALSERDYVHHAIDRADLILSIGHDTVEKPPFLMGPYGPTVIHVGYLPATVEEVFFPQAELVGDVAHSLTSLADRLEGRLPNAGALLSLRSEILDRIGDRAEESRFPLTPQRIVHDVRVAMPDDGIACLDNGMYKIWFARNYRTHVANTLLLDNALATMGAGLPSAIMTAMLYPDRRVLAVCGDGGFMMNSQELETAVRVGANLVVLIIQDGAFGMIRWKQATSGHPDFGLTFGDPDFVAYAQAYGAKGTRVESADGLAPALEAAFAGGGVHLVIVPVDYSENIRVLVDELRANAGRPMIEVVQAFDRAPITTLPADDAQAQERKIQAARAAFEDRASWAPPHQRIAVLRKLATLMEARREHLARQIAREGGKPLTDALVETDRAIDGVRDAAEELRNLAGCEIPMGLTSASTDRRAFTVLEPIGVVAAISAFNHPLNLIVHQVAPAIAVGCPVIIKPANTTPLSCLEFVDLVHEAGLAPDWCQVFLPEGNDLAEALATDPRVAFLSFIGSSRVGWYLRSKLPPGTRYALEHGGAAPAIIDRHADLDRVIEPMAKGGYYHAGQVCVSVQRIFVHADLEREFLDRFTARVAALRVGDPLSPETEVGPLILPREADRVAGWIDEAVAGGARLIGGGQLNASTLAPSILVGPPQDAKVSTLEIFGPVTCVYSYTDLEQAIAVANALPVAFQSSIFTEDLRTAFYAAERLAASAVMVNDHTAFRADWAPFAGRRQSGYGIGGIPWTMREMTEQKMVVFKG